MGSDVRVMEVVTQTTVEADWDSVIEQGIIGQTDGFGLCDMLIMYTGIIF